MLVEHTFGMTFRCADSSSLRELSSCSVSATVGRVQLSTEHACTSTSCRPLIQVGQMGTQAGWWACCLQASLLSLLYKCIMRAISHASHVMLGIHAAPTQADPELIMSSAAHAEQQWLGHLSNRYPACRQTQQAASCVLFRWPCTAAATFTAGWVLPVCCHGTCL